MITFLATLMAHCFGRHPVDEVIWIIAVMIGIMEILFAALLIAGALK